MVGRLWFYGGKIEAVHERFVVVPGYVREKRTRKGSGFLMKEVVEEVVEEVGGEDGDGRVE